MKKKISDFPTPHIYNSVVQQERKKNCISSTNFPLRVYKLLLWIDLFLCGSLSCGWLDCCTFNICPEWIFFVGIPVMWCEAPTKAYLIGISVSYRLTSQMSIIKFVFKISTLHNQNGNKSHAVEESPTFKEDLYETLKSVSSVVDVCSPTTKPFICDHCSLCKSLSDFYRISLPNWTVFNLTVTPKSVCIASSLNFSKCLKPRSLTTLVFCLNPFFHRIEECTNRSWSMNMRTILKKMNYMKNKSVKFHFTWHSMVRTRYEFGVTQRNTQPNYCTLRSINMSLVENFPFICKRKCTQKNVARFI